MWWLVGGCVGALWLCLVVAVVGGCVWNFGKNEKILNGNSFSGPHTSSSSSSINETETGRQRCDGVLGGGFEKTTYVVVVTAPFPFSLLRRGLLLDCGSDSTAWVGVGAASNALRRMQCFFRLNPKRTARLLNLVHNARKFFSRVCRLRQLPCRCVSKLAKRVIGAFVVAENHFGNNSLDFHQRLGRWFADAFQKKSGRGK